MSAREQILARVRLAIGDVENADPVGDVEVPWNYGRPTAMDDVLGRFTERVEDYRAEVVRCPAEEIGQRIAAALQAAGVRRIAAPEALDSVWLQEIRDAGLEVVTDPADSGPLPARQLDGLDGVVSAAAVGIAETGTVVLDHRPDQGRRALTLVPDLHVCVVRVDQVVSDVPEAVARLADSVRQGLPLTWISGPSATSDIELDRVEGVHGPRTLVVILADRADVG
ncbi:lactate utilization protein C [Enemella evansiae]|uniref:Lactate utilization protein C n=1 Tax=Enemella evansiae TaxID=2016499 RepID=A0A255FW62_9ACTN|nr:lactate utilization protein C [Enemella evansiae]OYO07929.1 lactate utilization protein C [Enemella evansiae]